MNFILSKPFRYKWKWQYSNISISKKTQFFLNQWTMKGVWKGTVTILIHAYYLLSPPNIIIQNSEVCKSGYILPHTKISLRLYRPYRTWRSQKLLFSGYRPLSSIRIPKIDMSYKNFNTIYMLIKQFLSFMDLQVSKDQ